MLAHCLSNILHGLMELLDEKMARKQYITTEEVLWELAMDSDRDMEPDDDDILPNGDDFVAENSGEAMLEEPVFVRFFFFFKRSGKCLLNYPPFQHGNFFVTMTTTLLVT